MSILIKGMDMPKYCRACPLSAGFSSCGIVKEKIQGGYCNKWHCGAGRPDWCPLVEIKTPHGELIERKSAKVRYCQNCHWRHSIEDACEICAGCPIDSIPTIIEAEGGVEDG